jgi:hypothetical protein
MIMSIGAFKRFPALTDRNTANLDVAAGQAGKSPAVPLKIRAPGFAGYPQNQRWAIAYSITNAMAKPS